MLKNGKVFMFKFYNIAFHFIKTYTFIFYSNYLHGRIAGNSLLGAMELERVLHNREVRVYVGTWNMNGQVNNFSFLFNGYLVHLVVYNYTIVIFLGPSARTK